MRAIPASGATASATVWREGEWFRVNIEIRTPDKKTEDFTARVSGDPSAVRQLIEREVGQHGIDPDACSIWWKLKELIPLIESGQTVSLSSAA